jgi:hypothetical protein
MSGKILSRSIAAIFTIVALASPHNANANATHTFFDYESWIFQKMSKWAPPGKIFIPEAEETPEEAQERYKQIAKDATEVAFDPSEKPLFSGRYGRSQTVAMILSVAWWESRYRRDVDLNLGKRARGDHGQSWCMMQVKLGEPIKDTDDETPSRIIMKDNGSYEITSDKDRGWTGGDLIHDRQKCFHAGLRMIRNSFNSCSKLPVLDRLSVYASGDCHENQPQSRARVGSAVEWLSYRIPPLTDSEVINSLSSPEESVPEEHEHFVTPNPKPVIQGEQRAARNP